MASKVLNLLNKKQNVPNLNSLSKVLEPVTYNNPYASKKKKAPVELTESYGVDNTPNIVDTSDGPVSVPKTIPAPNTKSSYKGINPRLSSIADPVLKKYGLTVSSGYRPNSKLKTSQHVHGNAYDVPWGTTDVGKRREIIKAFQDAGITGFGVGNNILHVDVGDKRHWTYDNSGNWISGMMTGYKDMF